MDFERGSEWRRWDLHLHTPGTKKNDRFKGNTIEEKWEEFYNSINTYISDGKDPQKNIAVIAITDYLSIDNYKKVMSDNRLPKSIYLVLPNVEMRVQPIANDTPINIHFIFNPDIIDEIETRFFSKLSFKYGDTDFSASRLELKRLGQTMDTSLDNDKAYVKGIEQFVPSFDAITKIFSADPQLRENTLVLVSNSSTDGVSGACNHSDYLIDKNGDSQLKAFRQSIYKFVDGIFSSTPSDIDFFLGKKVSCPEELVIKECGSLKPCVHGCDAHENSKIFEPDLQKYCWIKADPTFNGLKQIIYEPEERVRISESIPDYKQSYYTIDRIEFDDPDFQKAPVYFNENLTCIIGGKSTGKSILLHNLANYIDSYQVKDKENVSKTNTKDVANAQVVWSDDKSDEDRKIIYIPQTYLNRLSDEKESSTEIDTIIEDVILIDENIKKANRDMFDLIKKYKNVIQQTILETIANHNEIIAVNNSKKELGNKQGIENEIEVLSKRKEDISKTLSISDDDLKSYEEAIEKIKDLKRKISIFEEEIKLINSIKTIVSKRGDEYNFCDYTKDLLNEAIKNTISAADVYWKSEKTAILEKLSKVLEELKITLKDNQNIETALKDKVNENKSIKDLSEKIQEEKEKLKKYNTFDEKEKELIEKENSLINNLCSSKDIFKNFQMDYANLVNKNAPLTGGDLEFSVIVPLRRESFVEKLSGIFNNRIRSYTDIVDPDKLSEENYTTEWLKRVAESILNNTLQLKAGYNMEMAFREIFDNWYGVKYSIKMDNDSIDVMSPGKKALVLLKLLIDLAESKCPILIDQPEDDLDNRSIFKDLIPFIKAKKKERQIIIVTHNANVVLGADAEEIIVANQTGRNVPNKEYRFEYRSGAIENNKAVFKVDGNVEDGILNSRGIQQHICDILEGGEKAFELRKKKYHI